jgi:hypothetical protein
MAGQNMNDRNRLTWISAVGGVLVVLGLLFSVFRVNYVGNGPSKSTVIANNLRQLYGAMQQWGLDHRQPDSVIVTEEDVAPYLRHPLKPAAGERYVLKTLSESPEAHLTQDVSEWPAGSVLRLNTNGDFEVVSPNRTNAAKHGRSGQ